MINPGRLLWLPLEHREEKIALMGLETAVACLASRILFLELPENGVHI